MSATVVDERRLAHLSDLRMYPEAARFLQTFLAEHALPPTQQLIGLLTFSRSWVELLGFVRHQEGREWGNKTDYKEFYTQLRRYLDDSKTGLRQRVKSDLKLLAEGLTAKQEREAQEQWAGALAHEFVQHLVAAALYHVQGGRRIT